MKMHFDATYFETEARMLLSSPTIHGLILSSSTSGFASADSEGLKELVIEDDGVRYACIASLSYYGSLCVRHIQDPAFETETYLVYPGYRPDESESAQSVAVISAKEFVEARTHAEHLNISSMNISPRTLGAAPGLGKLKSLDLSRLGLDDRAVGEILSEAYFRSLKWLDLSGNSRISYGGIAGIADVVLSRRFPVLKWLDLIGTDCDATPYVDGYTWRISDVARGLAERFGFQPWMMLGSRIPEMEGRELLSDAERQIPPDRFS